MERIRQVRRLFDIDADEDFEFASVSLNEHDRFYSRIYFHFQQAAEEYLKAYIVVHALALKKIHD